MSANEPNKSKTIIVAGNGVLENGWAPLEELVDLAIDDQNFKVQSELYLIKIAQDFRREISRWRNDILLTRGNEESREFTDFEKFQSIINRTELAKNYAQNQLQLRSIPEYINEVIRKGANIITTNWDRALESQYPKVQFCHIHGECEKPQSIILPSETVFEINEFYEKQKDNSEISQFYLEEEELRMFKGQSIYCDEKLLGFYGVRKDFLSDEENKAKKWLEEATEIIFWGIGLHVYDFEILNLLNESTRDHKMRQNTRFKQSKLKKITIINPDKDENCRRRVWCIFKPLIELGIEFFHICPICQKESPWTPYTT